MVKLIESFIKETGASEDEANNWLSKGEFDLDTAVNLYSVNLNLIKSFIEATGASEYEAKNWLEIGVFDLDTAVNLYDQSNETSYGNQNNNESVYSPNYLETPLQTNNDIYYDCGDVENIRKPDQIKRRKLIVDNSNSFNSKPKNKKEEVSAFSSGSNLFIPTNKKEKTLHLLFRPPTDIIIQEDLFGARELSKSKDKWLIINIQSNSEFECHKLNRDVWNNENFKEFFMIDFLFWQQQDISEEGQRYIKIHNVTNFPHIAIMDPRTGCLNWRVDKAINKEILIEKLLDFINSNPSPNAFKSKSLNLSKPFNTDIANNNIIDLCNDDEALVSVIKESLKSCENIDTASSSSSSKPISISNIQEKKIEEEIINGFSASNLRSFMNPIIDEDICNKLSIGILDDIIATISNDNIENQNEFEKYLSTLKTKFDSPQKGNEKNAEVINTNFNSLKRVKLLFKLSNATKVSHSFPCNTPVQLVAIFVAQNLNEDEKDKSFEILCPHLKLSFSEIIKSQDNYCQFNSVIDFSCTLNSIGITSDTAVIVKFV